MIKTFKMIRNFDESNISGTGVVLNGAVFPDGATIVQWCGKSGVYSMNIYKSFEDFKFIHVDSHPNNLTEIVWDYQKV